MPGAVAPEKVNHKAPPDEMQAAVAPAVHDLMDDLSQTTEPEVRNAVVATVADAVTPSHPLDPPLDMSRLIATAIAEVYRQTGQAVPDMAELEAAAINYGVGVSGPMPGSPGVEVPLTTDEVRERTRKARQWSAEILSHPSAKKAATIDAILASPPMTFYSPEPRIFSVNGAVIAVPEGEVLARDHTDRHGMPDGDVCGCIYVANLVAQYSQTRRWEVQQQKALKQSIIYGEVEDRPTQFDGVPRRGSIS
jgi:hypothetical protein